MSKEIGPISSPDRIRFVDAWRWLQNAQPGDRLPDLVINPERPGRYEPRARKRRPKEYDLMTKPRAVLKEELKWRLYEKPTYFSGKELRLN